jgi:hypothetical protein
MFSLTIIQTQLNTSDTWFFQDSKIKGWNNAVKELWEAYLFLYQIKVELDEY